MSHILQQNVAFCHDVLDFVASNNGFLLEDFDGIALACLLVTCKVHLQRHRWKKKGREGGPRKFGDGREGGWRKMSGRTERGKGRDGDVGRGAYITGLTTMSYYQMWWTGTRLTFPKLPFPMTLRRLKSVMDAVSSSVPPRSMCPSPFASSPELLFGSGGSSMGSSS